jgi:putative SOS response-associated peptidase YedK
MLGDPGDGLISSHPVLKLASLHERGKVFLKLSYRQVWLHRCQLYRLVPGSARSRETA